MHRNRRCHRTADHSFQFPDHGIKLQDVFFLALFAGKSQQLPGQIHTAQSSTSGGIHPLAGPVIISGIILEKIQLTDNNPQLIIEIMGNTTR